MDTGKIICSWRVLFRKAHAMGQARLRYKGNPSAENADVLKSLEEDHAAYEKLCLRADEMIDTPCLDMP